MRTIFTILVFIIAVKVIGNILEMIGEDNG